MHGSTCVTHSIKKKHKYANKCKDMNTSSANVFSSASRLSKDLDWVISIEALKLSTLKKYIKEFSMCIKTSMYMHVNTYMFGIWTGLYQ